MNLVPFSIALLLLPLAPSHRIPAATVIPVMLSTSLNAAKDKVDKRIEGRVMQDVPLPSGSTIREGARIVGHTIEVNNGESGSRIVLKFTTIEDEGRKIRVALGLLAVASMMSVSDARSPVSGNSDKDPDTQWVTRQVGGDVVRRGWGKVFSSNGLLGRWVGDSSVLIKLTPNPGAGCNSGPGYDSEQAVWIFSSAACGTYGLPDVKLTKSGLNKPIGEISLTSSHNINIRGGSGWLLITAEEPSEESE